MSNKNKYGLSRHISDKKKRWIRQRDGFGCIICGASIIEYEHVDPEFANAKSHDKDKITLLCKLHHGMVTTKFLSKDAVKRAMLDPFCKRQGFSNSMFDFGLNHPHIIFGGNKFLNCDIPIQIRDIPLFEIKEPEQVGAPFRLTAYFYDSKNRLSLSIIENEWKAYSSNWDVIVSAGKITVTQDDEKVSLKLTAIPNIGIEVEELNMKIYDYTLIGNKTMLDVYQGGSRIKLISNIIDNCHIGLNLS